MASMVMVALEATIVATAVPQIVARIGGGPLYGWIFSGFLLAQSVTTPLWGRMADLYGRRPVLATGLALFLSGSLLCGFATGLPMLVAARVLQGVGAGGVQPLCATLVGDLYEGEARTRAQGWLSSIWGPAGLVAPALGALLIQTVGWRWVFWINVLPGAVALAGVSVFLPRARPDGRGRARLDLAGALLFAAVAVPALLLLGQAGSVMGGRWAAAAALALVVAVAAPLFLHVERRVADPVIPLRLWSLPQVAGPNAVTLLGCMTLMGVTALLPLFIQGAMGRSPLQAGLAPTAMAIGWPTAAVWARSLHRRLGRRLTLVCGGGLLSAGSSVFCLLDPQRSIAPAILGAFVSGMGMGFLTMTAIVVIQAQTAAEDRASATSSNIFSRALGGALGAALLSAVLTVGALGPRASAHVPAGPSSTARLDVIASTSSLHAGFLAVLALSLLTFALSALVATRLRDGSQA